MRSYTSSWFMPLPPENPLGESRYVALLCFEASHKAEDWCHPPGGPHDETAGHGWQHVQLLPRFRALDAQDQCGSSAKCAPD
jgi:hypothetical protein